MSTRNSSKNINKNSVIKELIVSGIDFFDSSISYLESEPKFSIVHFATALELILKTRLASQHWALLLDRLDKISVDKFISGDFQSVQASTIVERINGLCGQEIYEDEQKSYKHIFDHRNRIVHYYHKGLSSTELKNDIIKSEIIAWHYLSKRLKIWSDAHLKLHKTKIDSLLMKMARLDSYSAIIFDKVRNDIEHAKQDGKCICYCFVCSKDASIVTDVTRKGNIFSLVRSKCLVCGFYCGHVLATCQNCNESVVFEGTTDGNISCHICGHDISKSLTPAGGFDYETRTSHDIFCPTCGRENVVVDTDGTYICLLCGEWGHEVSQCEWCHTEYFSFDPEGSHLTGCTLCNGIDGYRKDE